MSSWDELLGEAHQELARQEEENPNADIGEDMTPSEESHVQVRWRGLGEMQTREGKRTVALVWRAGDNAPGFLYGHTQLLAQVDEVQPEIGDEVLVLRGATRYFEKQGEERKTYPYAVRKRSCADPLPGDQQLEPPKNDETPDEELPFLCRAERVNRSAIAAAAATASA
jgi:hypothetical protein